MSNTNATSSGWNRPTGGTVKNDKRGSGSKARVLVACLGVVFLVGLGVWFFAGEDGAAKTIRERNGKAIREVKPARPAKTVAASSARPQRKPKTVAEALQNLEPVATPKPVKKAARPVDPKDWPKPVFSSSTEQLMSLLFTNELGNMPVPVPQIDEQERKNIVAILISKNEIKDEDDDDVIDCKKTVDAAKKEMLKFLKEGGDPDEFLAYYAEEQERIYNFRNEAIRQAQELSETDRGMMADFVKTINSKFKNDGIMQIEPRDIGLEEEDYHLLEEEKEMPQKISKIFTDPIDTRKGNMV